uniref:C-type lectin domain-containing protein n=1 Tax=Panagrolaimus superbus TaxID=310955 RepID=A0A914Y5Q3_9BILA
MHLCIWFFNIKKTMLKYFLLLTFIQICFSSCPTGTNASFTNPNNCYLFVSKKLEFITAEGYCRENGGHLTSISNAFDNMFLSQEAASNIKNNTEGDFWIGGTNELIPGTWTWMDGSPFTFTDWMKGQPENVSISNCAVSSILTSLWTAEDCFKSKTFVCLIPSLISTTTTTTTTTVKRTTTHKPYKCENVKKK